MCQSHVAWENPILIWGHKKDTSDGRVLKPLLHGEDVTRAIKMPFLNHIKFTCSEVTIPALEIEMLCCSIASWMLVRSASFILKQELTKFLSAILIR